LEKAHAGLGILSAMLTEGGNKLGKDEIEVEIHRAHFPQYLQMIF
jgi:hypothetical protein